MSFSVEVDDGPTDRVLDGLPMSSQCIGRSRHRVHPSRPKAPKRCLALLPLSASGEGAGGEVLLVGPGGEVLLVAGG